MTQPISDHQPTTLDLSAYITVTDRTGTTITTASLAEVVALIAHRSHAQPPRIGLEPVHHSDPFFQSETWTLVDGGFALTSIGSTNMHQGVDYKLFYHDWHLTDDNGQTIPASHTHPADVGQILANRSDTPVVLTSELPGISTQQFDPIPSQPSPTTADDEEHTMHNDHHDDRARGIVQFMPPTWEQNENGQDTAEEATHTVDAESTPTKITDNDDQPRTRRQARQSFLTDTQHNSPAEQGWRGALTNIGIRLKPSAKEQAERNDIHAVSQHWPGPRTIAVVNGKGGAGKTPTTILLAAVLARYGGGGVLAWDNNQFRGTLGWRTEQAGHENTILDLLPQAEQLLATGAQSADLAHFVHHQTTDRFDVLRSKPKVLADKQRFNQNDVDAVHQATSKFYRIIIIDSGNDESDALWQRMIDHTDQLVVATTTSDETAEGGALLLEDLANTGDQGTSLADNAVVVVSQSVADATQSAVDQKVKGFEPLAREVVPIPYDPAMVDGALTFSALHPTTQRAWLAAAASVARGL